MAHRAASIATITSSHAVLSMSPSRARHAAARAADHPGASAASFPALMRVRSASCRAAGSSVEVDRRQRCPNANEELQFATRARRNSFIAATDIHIRVAPQRIPRRGGVYPVRDGWGARRSSRRDLRRPLCREPLEPRLAFAPVRIANKRHRVRSSHGCASAAGSTSIPRPRRASWMTGADQP